MSTYRLKKSKEKRQNKLQVIQNWIMVATVVAIMFVGYLQYQINKQLYNAQYSPSVEIRFSQDRLTIYNRGKANLYVLGEQYPGEGSFLPPEGFRLGPQVIPAGESIYFAERWSEWLKYAKGEVENSQAKWNYFKFAHQFKDHDGNIFVHESFCRFEKDINGIIIYPVNFGSSSP